ncbi:transposable element Tcb1 transposase [Trichonephila clavipes]|uniref:Transposable element Tcb1 transposase n=1 Tax=Trichonephila clavipes TaxID=2585209 RepID=A0A8X6S2Y5_TRICX|nr:transposable element Tcb1 transposase [Trichonephila clavipes]
MPGKRARRHFSQLSEFERGLIIRMKTASWSTRRVAGQVDRSECAVRNCWEQWARESILQKQILNPSALSEWNVPDWQKVGFSDEFRFVLGTDDKRVRVWRRPGEQYNTPHTVLRHTARTAGVMVWGAIAYDSRSTLIVLHGTLTGQSYIDDIFRPHDQLKRQMPSCHRVHDLELAVQDFWAHLPEDDIRCLINSMPDRVAACIAAGVGPTRY